MLIAHVEPTGYMGSTLTHVIAGINYYDLVAEDCVMRYKLCNESGAYYVGTWNFEPKELLSEWGTDDTFVLNVFASGKGLTINSFEYHI